MFDDDDDYDFEEIADEFNENHREDKVFDNYIYGLDHYFSPFQDYYDSLYEDDI